MPALDEREVVAFLEEVWPGSTRLFVVEEIGDRTARLRMPHAPERLRPGGIVSGPALMTLADTAVWIALLGVIGPVAMAVTTDLTIHFLHAAHATDVIAEATLHKVSTRLAVGDVLMYADGGGEDPVARATVSYAIPQDHHPDKGSG